MASKKKNQKKRSGGRHVQHVFGWHSLGNSLFMANKGTNKHARKVRAGVTYSIRGAVDLCGNGLHASPTIGNALCYVDNPGGRCYVCFVESWGNVESRGDKYASKFRRVLSIIAVNPDEQDILKDSVRQDGNHIHRPEEHEAVRNAVTQRALNAMVHRDHYPVDAETEDYFWKRNYY